MKFCITELAINSTDQILISDQDFTDIRNSRFLVLEALAIEEKYYLLLQNYFDFEKALHDHALANLLFQDHDWSDKVDDIHIINKCLVNLLSAGKMYVDHIPQHLNDIYFPSLTESEGFTKVTNEQYDTSLGYRVFAALRNHTQHSDFPIQSLTYSSNGINFTGKRLCRHSATANIHLEAIERNRKFKPAILEELAKIGKIIDIKPMVRQYMSSFAKIHIYTRNIIEATVSQSDYIILTALEKFTSEFPRKPIGLHAVAIDSSGNHTERLGIFSDAIERRKYLARRATVIQNIENHFISGDIG